MPQFMMVNFLNIMIQKYSETMIIDFKEKMMNLKYMK